MAQVYEFYEEPFAPVSWPPVHLNKGICRTCVYSVTHWPKIPVDTRNLPAGLGVTDSWSISHVWLIEAGPLVIGRIGECELWQQMLLDLLSCR